MYAHPLIETVGIEIEYANIPKTWMRQEHMLPALSSRWSLVEDGSVRTHRRSKMGFETPDGESVKYGGELVSPKIFTTKEGWEKDLYEIIGVLKDVGEGIDARTSIHIHINSAGLPLFAVKHLFKIGLYLEASMYRLACAEAGIHRGALLHDYGYSRPLGFEGPPVVPDEDGYWRPVFDVNKLMNTRTINEFQRACGRQDRASNKWHEARYTWLNPISLFQHGSVEFRLFNMTHRPDYIIAWVKLCMDIVRESLGKQTELPENPLGTDNLDFQDVVEFLQITDPGRIYILEELWNCAEYQSDIEGHQIGHLGRTVSWHYPPGLRRELIPERVERGNLHSFNEFDTDEVIMKEGFTIIDCLTARAEPEEVEPERRRRLRISDLEYTTSSSNIEEW